MDIIRIVNAVFSSNTYVLREGGADWCWLVDVGDVEPVLEYIGEKGAIRGIFLTHTHYDHLYGINRMVDLLPKCVVYTTEAGTEGYRKREQKKIRIIVKVRKTEWKKQ